ncbi:MAG: cobyrinate a,c-diamide synthase [Rubrivivax sp.]|nr:cobyrinate a,c-diamide synthase [Rubrivivax sp.]
MHLPRLMISAAHKSSGKTTVALGLAAAWAAEGLAVQPFKKGPDYIDPMWLALASERGGRGDAGGRPCFNLDPHLSTAEAIIARVAASGAGADLALVEGNKGLYDGLALDGSNSNAALATMLGLPVVLVLDARGMTRGVAPLVLGYQAFDRNVRIAGVVLNRVGGARHEAKLRAVIEHYTDVPVLGAVAEDAQLAMTERHLGLPTCAEREGARAWVEQCGRIVAAQVDLARLREVAASAPALAGALAPSSAPDGAKSPSFAPVRIGIARDRAFGFYYPDDLEALRAAGAELVFFDTLHDAALPAALDGLVIGGGFPETSLDALQANAPLRAALREAVRAGLPTYAECGGLMLLARSVTWRGRRAEMVGVIPADAVMHERPVGRGYVELEETAAMPWPAAGAIAQQAHDAARRLRGHEFHHSSLDNLDAAAVSFAYRVTRGHGIDGRHDGLCMHNLLASYSHLRGGAGSNWPQRFVEFVRRCRAAAGAQPFTPTTPADLACCPA